ncbi:MAG: hypothetical protein HWE14_06680 [Flavobacteriia bacterium]|nr:hypothetical protein [Flavobacteriia bacterium]
MKYLLALLISCSLSSSIAAHRDKILTLVDSSHIIQFKYGFQNFNTTKLKFFEAHLEKLVHSLNQQDSVFIILKLNHIYLPGYQESESKLILLNLAEIDSLRSSPYSFPEMKLSSKRIWEIDLANEKLDFRQMLKQIEFLINNQSELQSQMTSNGLEFLDFDEILPKADIHDYFNPESRPSNTLTFLRLDSLYNQELLPESYYLESNLEEYRIIASKENHTVYSFSDALYVSLLEERYIVIVETLNKITLIDSFTGKSNSALIPLGGFMDYRPPIMEVVQNRFLNYKFFITTKAEAAFKCDGDFMRSPESVEVRFTLESLEPDLVDGIYPCPE